MIRERKNIAKPEINRTDGVTFEDAWRIMTERRSPEVADPRLLPVSSLEEEDTQEDSEEWILKTLIVNASDCMVKKDLNLIT